MAEHEFKVGDKGKSRDGGWDAECIAIRDDRAIWCVRSSGRFAARVTWINGKCSMGDDTEDDIVPVPPPMKRVPYTRETWPADCVWLLFQGESYQVLRIGEATISCREWTYGYDYVAKQGVRIGPTMNGPWQPACREVPDTGETD